jgi:hypothetical protein
VDGRPFTAGRPHTHADSIPGGHEKRRPSLRFLQGRGVSLSSHSGLSPSHVLGQRWVHKDSCTFFGIQVSFKFSCLC